MSCLSQLVTTITQYAVNILLSIIEKVLGVTSERVEVRVAQVAFVRRALRVIYGVVATYAPCKTCCSTAPSRNVAWGGFAEKPKQKGDKSWASFRSKQLAVTKCANARTGLYLRPLILLQTYTSAKPGKSGNVKVTPTRLLVVGSLHGQLHHACPLTLP